MKTTLICFPGTGNSYYIAKRLASELGDCRILMIPHLMQNQAFELTEQVGFVFPVYKGFPPNLVTHFIQEVFAKQDLGPVKYLFQIATRYMFQAYTFQAMDVVLREAGAITSYVNHVVMPDGYVPLLAAPTEGKSTNSMQKPIGRLQKSPRISSRNRSGFPSVRRSAGLPSTTSWYPSIAPSWTRPSISPSPMPAFPAACAIACALPSTSRW
jgi:hypothetical protein